MNPLMASGVELMLVGMGTVFVFLTLLVIATTLMSRIVLRIAPPQPDAPADGQSDATLVAVIAAAIAKHRERQQ
jgi:oxaloacetate decarboxylase gamma subunit